MNKLTIVVALVAVMAFTALAFAQEDAPRREGSREGRREGPPRGGPRGGPDRELDMRKHEMDLKARESEMQFQGEMREIELDERRAELERSKKQHGIQNHHNGACGPLLLVFCAAVHILLTVWVYRDMHKRNAGSGLWIAIVLLTGILGALLYALVRRGDMQAHGA